MEDATTFGLTPLTKMTLRKINLLAPLNKKKMPEFVNLGAHQNSVVLVSAIEPICYIVSTITLCVIIMNVIMPSVVRLLRRVLL